MKIFQQSQLREAKAYAAAGGQALHLFSGGIADAIGAVRKIPNCFRGRRELAHLIDQDRPRLEATARRLGVRVVFVDRAGTDLQHVDLCGGPLERAKAATLLECPDCGGLPEHPDVEGCRGCMKCDFTGTKAGAEQMKRYEAEGWAEFEKMEKEHKVYVDGGVCSRCGACNQAEASDRCKPSAVGDTGDYECPGEDLWQEGSPANKGGES